MGLGLGKAGRVGIGTRREEDEKCMEGRRKGEGGGDDVSWGFLEKLSLFRSCVYLLEKESV